MDVFDAFDEVGQSLLLIREQSVRRDDDLPLAVPDAATYQAGVGIDDG